MALGWPRLPLRPGQWGLGSSLASVAAGPPSQLLLKTQNPGPAAVGSVWGTEPLADKPLPLGLGRGHTSSTHLAVAGAVASLLPSPSPHPAPRVRGGVA